MASPFRDPRTQILYFRKGIPEDLRPFMGGRREFKVSLETRDPAEAKPRFIEQASRYEREVATARAKQVAGFEAAVRRHVAEFFAERDCAFAEQEAIDSLPTDADESPAQREHVRSLVSSAMRGMHQSLARRLADKWALMEVVASGHTPDVSMDTAMTIGNALGIAPVANARLADQHRLRAALLGSSDMANARVIPALEAVRRLRDAGNFLPVGRIIEAIGKRHGLSVVAGDPAWRTVGTAVYDHIIGELEVDDDEDLASLVPAVLPVPGVLPVHPAELGATATATASTNGKAGTPISTVLADWERSTGSRENVRREWAAAVGQFIRIFGDIAVEAITTNMARDFRDLLVRLPSNPPRTLAKLSLADQAAYADEHGLPRIAAGTAKKKMIALRSVLAHAVDPMRLIDANPTNDVRAVKNAKLGNDRQAFELEDIVAILTKPVRPNRSGVSEKTIYWLLLLGAFHGARISELVMLRPGNVRRTEGIDYLAIELDDIESEPETTDSGRRDVAKSVKTKPSLRHVPVHPFLLEAGFLDLVERARTAQDAWLFADISPEDDANRSTLASKLVMKHIRDAGVTSRQKVFHSFRHTVRNRLSGAGDPKIQDYVVGHAPATVGAKYAGGGTMQARLAVVAALEYDGLPKASILAGVTALSRDGMAAGAKRRAVGRDGSGASRRPERVVRAIGPEQRRKSASSR